MQTPPSVLPRPEAPPSAARLLARWALTFAGYPAAGLTAHLVVGPADGLPAAALGGLVSGAIVGTAQWWALRPHGLAPRAWIAGTAVAFAAGLTLATTLLDLRTTTPALALQGAVGALLVGGVQAGLLARRLGAAAAGWPLLLGLAWVVGWLVTIRVGVRLDEHWTLFGSSGAAVATVVTAPLTLALRRRTAVAGAAPVAAPTTTARSATSATSPATGSRSS